MRFFLRYLSLEGKKKPDSGEKKHGKFIVMLLLIAGRSACGQSRYEGCRCVPNGGDWRCDPEDEAQTKMVAQFISAMDSVKSVCHFST